MHAPSRAARWSGFLGRAHRGVGLLLLVGLLGCLGPAPEDVGRVPDSGVQRQLARIRDTALPPNYPVLIAARVGEALNDPQTRTIVYTATPYGSLVCGTITARHRGRPGPPPLRGLF